MRQRLLRIESRNAGVVVTVSDRALSVRFPILASLAPGTDESPAHGCKAANLSTPHLADGEDRLCRRDVVSRMIVNLFRGFKALGQILLRARQSVSIAHPYILTDSACELLERRITRPPKAKSQLALGRNPWHKQIFSPLGTVSCRTRKLNDLW